MFDVWDGKITHDDVGSWWFSGSTISKSSALQWCIICCFIWNFYKLDIIKGLRFELVYLHIRMSDHSDFQNLRFPSPELSNDVSYVGSFETFIYSTCLRFWGLRWYINIWGCRIMVIFRIYNLQVKHFPMMYLKLVYLKHLYSLYVWGFEVWEGIYTYEDVGSWWYSESMISKSRFFQRCIMGWFFRNFLVLYIIKGLKFQMV